jgi:hypothetical protein
VITSVFKTTGAVAAAAIDCAVVTQVACADIANNAGKKAPDVKTTNAANRRKRFIYKYNISLINAKSPAYSRALYYLIL